MSSAIKRQRIDTARMEPHFSGPGMSVSYHERSYTGHAWECSGCGLLWEKRWHAESCESRNHAACFEQRYGGYVENGQHKGGSSFVRKAISRNRRATTDAAPEPEHSTCPCGSGLPRWELKDARGIGCGLVCERCEQERRSHYRADIFTDPNYWHDEPL